MHYFFLKKRIVLQFMEKHHFRSLKKRVREKLLSRFRSNGRVREMQAQLPALANDLEAACKGVEPEFMRIGQELQAIYGDAAGLTRKVLDSVNLISGKEGEGVFFQLRGLAEESLAELEGCQKDVSKKTDLIKMVMEHLGSLSAIFPLIEKIGLLLRIVAMTIGIESARSSESTELFSVVAQETGKLSEKIKAISEGSLDVLKSARDTQQSLYGNLSEGQKEINRLGENAHSIVRDAVLGTENLMTSTLQVAEQAGEHSKAISRRVGDIVVAVQFHDSMSQRVEHITTALCDMGQLLAGHDPGEEDIDHKRQLSHAFSIIRLQSAQLKEIVAEINRVHEEGVRSFEEILREIGELLNSLSDLSASPAQNMGRKGPAGDPFKSLRASFSDLAGVLQRGQPLMDLGQHAASRASETVDRVSGLVQNIHTIGFETHLMALNAIVKAAHLGQEGGALEVISQEVKQSSDQCSSILGRTDELLGRVTGLADRLRYKSANGEAAVSMEGPMEEITRAYNQFRECSVVACERADEIKEAISKTKADLDFMPVLAKRLTGFLHQFETMARDLSPFATEGHRMSQGEVDELLDRYTMDKEREVHEASFYGPPERPGERDMAEGLPEAHEDVIQVKKGETEEGLKDNIELFTDRATGQADELWDNVDLFDSEPEPEDKEGATKALEMDENSKNEEDLGDNVELF